MTVCSYCGIEIKISYICKKCGERFCATHKHPDSHKCLATKETRDKSSQLQIVIENRNPPGLILETFEKTNNNLESQKITKTVEAVETGISITQEESEVTIEEVKPPYERDATLILKTITEEKPKKRRKKVETKKEKIPSSKISKSKYQLGFEKTTVCDYCGKTISVVFTCIKCTGHFCNKHKSPEKHDCPSQ